MPENSSEHAFPLSGPINLETRIGSGSVTVTARDDLAEAHVRLTPRHSGSSVLEQFTVEMQGPTLMVIAPKQGGLSTLFGAFGDRDAVDAEIEVPSGTAMKINTGSAPIVVKGRCGGADLATGSGDITADTVDGDARLRSGSAKLHAEHVTGDVVVKTGSGDASFGEVGGSLQAGFGSGDITIDVARGTVRSRAGSGDAHVGAAYGDVDMSSGSGQLSVGLPQGTSARLDVHSGSGKVRSDLPIEDAPASERAITIRARTGSGDVRVFRAGEAA